MTIVQPLSSRVVVTVRPLSSTWEDIARALPLPPLKELALAELELALAELEEEDALEDERALPDRDLTLTEVAPRGVSPETDLISRPSARIRTS